MKVTYNWLKDFVDIKITPQALADKLTMAGLEVKSIEEKAGDFVFEIEITSNRPDWLSVAGVAREVAAVTGSRLIARKSQSHKVTKSQSHKGIRIEIEDKKDCPLYTAKIIREVKVGPSPEWLRKRLESIGCRSVNNIVDITNYILFTWGEPLHAFDLGKLASDTIAVRRARKGEKILSIDGESRALDADILVIADKDKPVAVAGIMGGKDTEVGFNTRNILLEAAVFNPVLIRRGRRKLGMQTDSSYRFERGIDPETAIYASSQAAAFIQELAGGKIISAKDIGLSKTKNKIITLDLTRAGRVLGITLPADKARAILKHLGFQAKLAGKNKFKVGVPCFRQDILSDIDLIEELARISGYERIPATLPKVLPRAEINTARDLVGAAKNILVGLGLNEVVTYSLTDKQLMKDFGAPDAVEIMNPLSSEQEILRPSLIPSLVLCVARNLNQKQEPVNIFEIAGVFLKTEHTPQEKLTLSIMLCGEKTVFLEQGMVKEKAGFLQLKGIIEALFEEMGIKDYSLRPEDRVHRYGVYIGQEKIGVMLKLDSAFLSKVGIKNREVFGLEVSLANILSAARLKKVFAGLPRYPGITRDISLLIKDELPAQEILSAIRQNSSSLLSRVKVVDYYKGKQIPAGLRSLTISCIYQSAEKTLTEEEVLPLHNRVCAYLTERFSVGIR